ncbi:MAG TPA: acyltransferase, partial [Polyangiaceae bacterium]
FYTLWPALVFFGSHRSVRNAALGLILIDTLLRLGTSLWPPAFATAQWSDLATFARADSLAVGALLALRQKQHGFGREARWALPVLVIAALGTVALRKLERHGLMPLLTYNLKWPLVAVLVGAVLLRVLVHPPRALSFRWLAWLGKISYGVYLIHGIFGGWLHRRFTLAQAPLIFAIQFGLTVPLAALSWYLFESPILQNKRFWPMPRRPGRAPVSALHGDVEPAKPDLG